jgi:hypothetical protein
MLTKWRRRLCLATIAGGLGCGSAAMAQTTFQPFKALFGSRSEPDLKSLDSNRMKEIQVELAWLSDRITFCYFLEAHVKGANLEVRGYVPNKVVRDQTINLAKLNSTLLVTDALKEHPSLAFRPVRRAPDQLTSSVRTALREAFPGLQLNVQCQSDGTVVIAGTVRSFEQKLAVSQALRRLHGCTSVTNFTELAPRPVDVARQSTPPANTGKSLVVAASSTGAAPVNVAPEQKHIGLFGLFTKTSPPPLQPQQTATAPTATAETATADVKITTVRDDSAPVFQPAGTGLSKKLAQSKELDPYETHGVIAVSTDVPKRTQAAPTAVVVPPLVRAPLTPAPKTAMAVSMTAAQLNKRIESAVPGVRHVGVTFTSKTDVRVDCAIRAGEDHAAIAGQIHAMRELENYNVDLRIQVAEKR